MSEIDGNFYAFPGENPAWVPVPVGELGTPPYNRICQVKAFVGDEPIKAGTGWLYATGKILTAAHVVTRASAAAVRFADQSTWIPVAIGGIAEGYFAPNGAERKCSPADLALLVPLETLTTGVAVFAPFAGGLAVAVGFAKGVLVRHAGSALDVGPFVAHNCDTDHEHSGCPIFAGDTVRGIHVGQFSGSRQYLRPPASQTTGYLNSAIRLTAGTVPALG